MRYVLFVFWMLFGSVPSAMSQVSIGIGLPGVSIGVNLPLYPEMVQVPDYPVYYAPRLNSNYFYYDGMYWVYQGDNWYASSWYNGPWGLVSPEIVPLFVLRIPVRYYRNPPVYFSGWWSDAPPRWGEHWGNAWEQHRSGWDRWSRNSAPALAPLPSYQRQYAGDRYPQAEQQRVIRSQNYRYQPRDAVVQQHYREQAAPSASAPAQRGQQPAPQERNAREQDAQRSSPQQQSAPAAVRTQPPQRGHEDVPRTAPAPAPPQAGVPAAQEQRPQAQQRAAQEQRPQAQQRAVQEQRPQAPQGAGQEQRHAPQPQQAAVQREQQSPRSSPESVPQARETQPARGRGQAEEKERDKGEERGQDRNR